MFSRKWVAAAAAGALLLAGQALAADKRVVAVSIPAADHGWTAGIVYHAQAAAKEINAAMKRASEQQLKGILGYTTAPNVSIDFNHDPHSSTFHMDQTKVQNGTLVRVMSWYDNEWGFSNRMSDTAVAMGKLL